jgi:hypothetical protein
MKSKYLINYFLKIIFFFSFILSFQENLFSQVIDEVEKGINIDSLKKSEPGLNVDSLNNSMAADTVGISKNIKNKSYIPDTLFLKTGDRITGRILSFEQGRLKIDGQGPGVISIKWYKILSISGGNRIFKVEDINGVKYFGRIGFSDVPGEIDILGKLKYGVMLENIVRIYPLEAEWYRGIKGSLGGGLNYAKSSDVLTANSQYNLYYVISKWRFVNDFSYVSTSTSNEAASVRIQTNLQALYALPNNWVLSEINSFNRNDELGVKSRFSFGIGGGNSIVQTDWQRLLALTGIVENLEKDIETQNTISNIEWPFTLQHTIYKFMSPNLSSTTSITSFVGVTEKGRYRLDASTDITWEFVTNFKLQITFYYNFDNKNIEGKNTKEDHGTVVSLLLDLK